MRTGALGRRGHGGYKNKASGAIYGRAGQDLDPMAGEISPDIMFWAVWRKVSKWANGCCRLVRMGEIGCVIMGRSKNKAKSAANSK